MREIKLSQQGKNKGKFVALIDNEDYKYLNQWRWHVQKQRTGNYYAARIILNKIGKTQSLRMHTVIMNPSKGKEVDHIDHNGLNNQKSNLRNCTRAGNTRNRSSRSASGYMGVYTLKNKRSKTDIIVAKVQVNNKQIYLGCFKTLEKAAIARDKASKKYFGEFANLNFK